MGIVHQRVHHSELPIGRQPRPIRSLGDQRVRPERTGRSCDVSGVGFRIARRGERAIERTRTPTYLYSYEYEIVDLSLDRVLHGVESNILFGNDYLPPLFPSHPLTAADELLHSAM